MGTTPETELVRLTSRYLEGLEEFWEPYGLALELVPTILNEEAGGRLGTLIGDLIEAEVEHPEEGIARRSAVAEALAAYRSAGSRLQPAEGSS